MGLRMYLVQKLDFAPGLLCSHGMDVALGISGAEQDQRTKSLHLGQL